MYFLEESYRKMQKIQILKFLRAPPNEVWEYAFNEKQVNWKSKNDGLPQYYLNYFKIHLKKKIWIVKTSKLSKINKLKKNIIAFVLVFFFCMFLTMTLLPSSAWFCCGTSYIMCVASIYNFSRVTFTHKQLACINFSSCTYKMIISNYSQKKSDLGTQCCYGALSTLALFCT